jgi:sugar/nucleoside kinase (ribokinase family)
MDMNSVEEKKGGPVDGRRGIMAGGNWIVDQVKIIDTYPAQDQLANIEAQSQGTGGSPFNILIDLARIGAEFPLIACGSIGKDAPGEWILDQCRSHNIAIDQLSGSDASPTSYTDVMTVRSTGRRTFFHQRGANAIWDGSELDFPSSTARIFHLGYLLLLDALDEPHPEFGTRAAELLNRAREAGLKTSIDVVSEDSDRFASIVNPALKYTDYAILNEIEAGKTTGESIRGADNSLNKTALQNAVSRMIDHGAGNVVVIHFPEGAYARTVSGREYWQPSLKLPDNFIKGGAGAGDAFCAGTLYGLHEGLDVQECLRIGVGAAATSLSHPTCTEGVGTLEAIRQITSELGFRDSI